jgi:predicted nucleic acid-binding protein
VKAVFADTFYWAALTNEDDSAHQRALGLGRALTPERIVTTDEVLTEYLAFFASARPSVRTRAGSNVAELIGSPAVFVVPWWSGVVPSAPGQGLQPD